MSKIGHKRWYIVLLLVLCYNFVYLGRASISIAGPVLMKEYNWNGTDFGLVSTAFFIGYALTMLPAGWLSDKFGSTKVIVAGTLLWSIFTFLTPVGAAAISFIIVIRIVVGIGQGVTLPSASSLISRWIPKLSCSATACCITCCSNTIRILASYSRLLQISRNASNAVRKRICSMPA